MTQEFFLKQIARLKSRFGEKAFDGEFVQLVAREVKDMSESSFVRFVDVMIGSRTAHKPPLLSEFREARQKDEKIRFDNDVNGAARALRRAPQEMRKHMQNILKKDFGGVESLTDALEVARLKRRTNGDEPA